MLAYQSHRSSGMPVFFLHGLFGSQQDWQGVLDFLQDEPNIRPFTVDLAGHGESQSISCHDFIEARRQLHLTIQQLAKQPFYLVGYSLGGRLALDYALSVPNTNLKGILLEGANIGLITHKERKTRWQNDCNWAARLINEPLDKVLADWYQQSVFASLSESKRLDFIKKRQHNQGNTVAQMLKATSLAKQTYFSPEQCRNYQGKMAFIIGEQDQKFRKMVEEHNLPYTLIEKAGHNVHCENPQAFAKQLIQFILN